jgi:cell pole-organizing protein PopZ
MPKPEQAPEPSIEEILASIRRIIADDAPVAAVHEAVLDEPSAAQAPVMRARPSALGRRPGEDEVLELTEDFMLAEEAPTVRLREPGEPDGFDADEPDEPQGEPYRDPYDESFARHSTRTVADVLESEPMAAVQDDAKASSEPEGLFSAVMAEVRRFTDGGQKDSGQKEEPVETASRADDNWGQPDMSALTPQPSARTPLRPVWSARNKEEDTGHAPADAAPSHPFTSEPVSDRKPNLAGKDGWNAGVQMPVPDAGPAIPFVAEDLAESPLAAEASFAPQPVQALAPEPVAAPLPPMEDAPAASAPAAAKAPVASDVQDKAEELADKAVSDFTSDRLSAPPVVADILKNDKPLMDAITSSLVNALSRGEEPEDFDDMPPPEDFADDMFGPAGLSDVAEEPRMSAQPERPAAPSLSSFDVGFIPQRPVAKAPELVPPDQEMPELPRDDLDDMGAAAEALSADRHAPASPRTAKPLMPNVPVGPGRAMPRPVAGLSPTRELTVPAERLQPLAGAHSLEDTIKEMLKPLLIQWLDENMPRIVNEALREEIAANGLLPKARGARR